jgi:hypothetical protein
MISSSKAVNIVPAGSLFACLSGDNVRLRFYYHSFYYIRSRKFLAGIYLGRIAFALISSKTVMKIGAVRARAFLPNGPASDVIPV